MLLGLVILGSFGMISLGTLYFLHRTREDPTEVDHILLIGALCLDCEMSQQVTKDRRIEQIQKLCQMIDRHDWSDFFSCSTIEWCNWIGPFCPIHLDEVLYRLVETNNISFRHPAVVILNYEQWKRYFHLSDLSMDEDSRDNQTMVDNQPCDLPSS